MDASNQQLVDEARNGSREALEALVDKIQDRIYGLALRMLCHPADAADATQEILVKIVTHIGSFEGRSTFATWAYRVASNHLLTTRRRSAEAEVLSFEQMEASLDTESAYEWDEASADPLQNMMLEEARISCLQGLLLCLDRDHRLAFLLSEVFGVSGQEGAEILDVSHQTYRKRLSRARQRMSGFLLRNCSLVKPENPCSCARYAALDLQSGRQKEDLVFAGQPCRARTDPNVLHRLQELKALNRVKELYNSYPEFSAPESFVAYIKELIQSDQFDLMSA